MPITRSIDHDTRIVTTQCEGRLTDEDIQVNQRMFWAQEWTAGYAEVFDISGADVSAILADRSRYAAVVAADDATDLVPVAFVLDPGDADQVALADHYIGARRAMSTNSSCEAFDGLDAALAWLNRRR